MTWPVVTVYLQWFQDNSNVTGIAFVNITQTIVSTMESWVDLCKALGTACDAAYASKPPPRSALDKESPLIQLLELRGAFKTVTSGLCTLCISYQSLLPFCRQYSVTMPPLCHRAVALTPSRHKIRPLFLSLSLAHTHPKQDTRKNRYENFWIVELLARGQPVPFL